MSGVLKKKYPEERRLVSVLFADVLGFTDLADQLDFEVVSDLMRNLWLKLDRVIEDYDGYIDKHIGDAFMVVWGAPRAREDDAERAVSAGLAILEALDEYQVDAEHPAAREIELRVGIHSGLALAGYVGLRGEYTVMGGTVNIAKRLEELAEPGTLVISGSTYQFIRGAYQVNRLETSLGEDHQDLEEVYQVIERLQQPSKLRYRSMGGLETRLVGREEELQKMESIFQRSLEGDQPRLALLIGEAGLGKSRLMMEFTNRLEGDTPRLQIMSSRALEQTEQVAFYIWKELWTNLFDINDDDPDRLARKKILDGILTLWGKFLGEIPAVEVAHFFGDMLGVEWEESRFLEKYAPDVEEKYQRLYELHGEFFRRASRHGPVVLVLDDLQWADRKSIELLFALCDQLIPDSPVFIVAAGRPSILTRYPYLEDCGEIIDLEPLPISGELVREAYPALDNAPAGFLEDLAERADGNPYYQEELVKSLLQSGYAGEDQDLKTPELPPTLQMLLQARLDALNPEARATALFAAVVGRVFWKGAVMALFRGASGVTEVFDVSSENLVGRVQLSLDELMRKELAFPRVGSTFSGEREYIFKQSLLRDVAYSLLPKKHRAGCHHTIAEWLAQRVGPERTVTVAKHYEQAGETDLAREVYRRAAEYAEAVGNREKMEEFQTRARELLIGFS